MRRSGWLLLVLGFGIALAGFLAWAPVTADAASISSRVKKLEGNYKKLADRVKKLEARVMPVGDDAPAPLDERVTAIEEALLSSGGDSDTAGIWQIIKAQFGEAGDGATGEVDRRFDALVSRLSAVETTAPLLVAGKLASLADHYEYVPTTMDGLAGPHIIFKGANVHIRNAGGAETADSKGNLILGYDRIGFASGTTSYTVERTGSHTLVIGDSHSWSAYGGVVTGRHNKLGAGGTGGVVLAGADNTLGGMGGAILGGAANTITGSNHSVITGGSSNQVTSGAYQSINGGSQNTVSSGEGANSILGGIQGHIGFGPTGVIVGGARNHIVGTPGSETWCNTILGGAQLEIKNGKTLTGMLQGSPTLLVPLSAYDPPHTN